MKSTLDRQQHAELPQVDIANLGPTLLARQEPGLRDSQETMAAPSSVPNSRESQRQLPVISVDLRSVAEGRGRALVTMPTDRDLEILSVLGQGGMARVFLARQHSLRRDVAIKTLQEDAQPAHRDALIEEGAITGFLEHPGIVPVHALGIDASGRPVLVMKRVEGVAWSELIGDPHHIEWDARSGEPSARREEHLEILKQVCNAAHFAHSRGIIHRDIKPQNVLIGRYGDVYLADWGIAHRTSAGESTEICGTPAYMAPEMVHGGTIDARTDVYLLGATLHEILTGKVLHPGSTLQEIVRDFGRSEPYDYGPNVPPALAEVARRATSPSPDDRYASAAELRAALADYARHSASIALASSALERFARLREIASSADDHRDEGRQREVDQLIAEARFGLTQATSQWSGNIAATEGLAELEALLARRRSRTAELERMADDLDPKIGARFRQIAQLVLSIVSAVLTSIALAKGVEYRPSGEELTREALVPLAALAILIALFWKTVWRTSVNRRIALIGIVLVSAIVIERAVGTRAGVPAPQMLSHDALMGGALCLAGIGGGLRWLGWIAPLLLAVSVGCSLLPSYAAFLFAIGSSLSLLMAAMLGGRVARA